METNDPKIAIPETGAQTQPRPHRFGIQSSLIYWGIVVVMASLLLWLGVQLARRIEWFLPYAGGFGLCLIVTGYFLELRKGPRPKNGQDKGPDVKHP
jgi:hypothetical protein